MNEYAREGEERGKGIPLSDAERVSRHWGVSLEDAYCLLEAYPIHILVPERGYGLSNSSPKSISGTTMQDFGLALETMEGSMPMGRKARVTLCTETMPEAEDLAQLYLDMLEQGFHLTEPKARLIIKDEIPIPTTTFTLMKGSPFWPALIAILPTIFIVGLIGFGLFRIGDISKALLPIILAVFGGTIIIVGLLIRPAERVAARYLESPKQLQYRPSTIPEKKAPSGEGRETETHDERMKRQSERIAKSDETLARGREALARGREVLQPENLAADLQTLERNNRPRLSVASVSEGKVMLMGTDNGDLISVQITGISGLTKEQLEHSLSDSVARIQNPRTIKLLVAAAQNDTVWWLVTTQDGKITELELDGIMGLIDRQLSDAFMNSTAAVSYETSSQLNLQTFKISPEEQRFAEGLWETTREGFTKQDYGSTYLWALATKYYPENKEKQIHAFGFMNEIASRSPGGYIDKDEVLKLARKWDVLEMVVKEMMDSLPQVERYLLTALAKTEVYVDELPKCDFCDEPAHYDGATRMGPWGYMCESHFKQYGRGLGTGVGQKLIPRKAIKEAEQIRQKLVEAEMPDEKERSVIMSAAQLEESVMEDMWYPICPYCGAETPAEPDASHISCQACGRRFRIINPYFQTIATQTEPDPYEYGASKVWGGHPYYWAEFSTAEAAENLNTALLDMGYDSQVLISSGGFSVRYKRSPGQNLAAQTEPVPATPEEFHEVKRIMSRFQELRREIKKLWRKACEYEGIPPESKFVVFSDDNPYNKEYNKLMTEMLPLKRRMMELAKKDIPTEPILPGRENAEVYLSLPPYQPAIWVEDKTSGLVIWRLEGKENVEKFSAAFSNREELEKGVIDFLVLKGILQPTGKEYVTIAEAGQSGHNVGDVVAIVKFLEENKDLKSRGLRPARGWIKSKGTLISDGNGGLSIENFTQTYQFFPEFVRKQLPPLYSQEKEKDPMVWVKFFTPWTSWTWYGTEFDGKDIFFGWVVGFENELGYFSLSELQGVTGPAGLKIERDINFNPKRLSEVQKEHGYEAQTRPRNQAKTLKELVINKGDRIRYIGTATGKHRFEGWPEGAWLERGVEGTVVEYHAKLPGVSVKGKFYQGLEAWATVRWDFGGETAIDAPGEGVIWEQLATSASPQTQYEFEKCPVCQGTGLDRGKMCLGCGGMGSRPKANETPPRAKPLSRYQVGDHIEDRSEPSRRGKIVNIIQGPRGDIYVTESGARIHVSDALPMPLQTVKDRLHMLYHTQIGSFTIYRDAIADALEDVKAGRIPRTGTLHSLGLSELQELKDYADQLWQGKQPAVIPTGPQPRQPREGDLEFIADSPEYIPQTIDNTGWRERIDQAFQEAVARTKGS